MKKKLFGSIAVLAIAAMAAFNVNINNSSENDLSLISLNEVEALAQEAKLCSSAGSSNNNGRCEREYWQIDWTCKDASWYQSKDCVK
jgi:predicted exporter